MQLDLSDPKQAHIDERLRQNLIAWFTSVRPDGRPHSVAVWFIWDGTSFLMFSKPKNQKITNIRQNANVLLALDDTKNGDDPIVFEGTAELLDAAATVPTEAYAEKYATLIQQLGWKPDSMLAEYSQAVRITPTKRLG
ncbi:MAG: pyridoxamine 5'-phosphate oxidase family protein [Ktedonobacterales bacterium]|nr:pyridoxamine 5'-phosphate oxidase family protein [Ktedonobacterales bacterium]